MYFTCYKVYILHHIFNCEKNETNFNNQYIL